MKGLQRKKLFSFAGFTLTEILIVVVIVAVLASLVLPRLGGQRGKALTSEAITIATMIHRALLRAHDEDGGYPGVLANDAAIKSTLGVDYQGVKYGWAFETDEYGNVTATRDDGTLTLHEDGDWSGTGDYATDTGPSWPYLPH